MAFFVEKTKAYDLDIRAQLLNTPSTDTSMASFIKNCSDLQAIVSRTTSQHSRLRFLFNITPNPISEVAFVFCLKSSAMARQLNPFIFTKIVKQIRNGRLVALSIRDTNYPSQVTVNFSPLFGLPQGMSFFILSSSAVAKSIVFWIM